MSQDPRPQNPPGGGPPPGGYPQPGQTSPRQPGGYPPQPGYPAAGPGPQAAGWPQPGGYPQPGAYPQPGSYPQPGGYPPGGGYPQPPSSYPPQGGHPPQPGYPPQAGYAPQGPYGPQGGYSARPPGVGPGGQGPKRKSPLLIIGIVVAAVVLVAAVGGIIMALSRGGGDQPSTSITPSQPTAPPAEPSAGPSGSSSPDPSGQPSDNPSTPPSTGTAVSVGNGIQLTPVDGWSVKKKTANAVQLSDGKSLYLGQSTKVAANSNPGQLCTAWHKQVAEGTSGGKYQDPKDVDLGTAKLKGSTCLAQVTVSSGQGSGTVYLFSIVSVRTSDGVTAVGTLYFSKNEDSDRLDKDFTAMSNSMLDSQAKG